MGSHGGLFGFFAALMLAGGVREYVRLERPESSTKRKKKTAGRREKKRQRQTRKRSRGW